MNEQTAEAFFFLNTKATFVWSEQKGQQNVKKVKTDEYTARN